MLFVNFRLITCEKNKDEKEKMKMRKKKKKKEKKEEEMLVVFYKFVWISEQSYTKAHVLVRNGRFICIYLCLRLRGRR